MPSVLIFRDGSGYFNRRQELFRHKGLWHARRFVTPLCVVVQDGEAAAIICGHHGETRFMQPTIVWGEREATGPFSPALLGLE